MHRGLDRSLVRLAQAGKLGIERIELMKIAMAAYRRAWAAIACPFPSVEPGGGKASALTPSASPVEGGGRL